MTHVFILETYAIDETSLATTIQQATKKGLSFHSGKLLGAFLFIPFHHFLTFYFSNKSNLFSNTPRC